MLKVNKDSIEYLPVQVTDRLEGITTLDGHPTHYRITDGNEEEIVAWTSCNTDDMTVLPLIDTTNDDIEEGATLKLYVRINITPEIVILGPFPFEVS